MGLAAEIKADDHQVSAQTAAKYMKRMCLWSKLCCKYKGSHSYKPHSIRICPNHLDRQSSPDAPGKVWVSDITYVHTKEHFVYLTSVIDLHDRKVVGWSLSYNLTARDTAVRAYQMAVKNRKAAAGMIFHSDRGVQYASEEFRSEIKGQVVQSMSRKGNCWDNAVAESFFRNLKCEMIYGNIELSPEQMELEIFEYIETSGLALIAAVAMAGSTKWRFGEVLIAVVERNNGDHTGVSSTMKTRRRSL